MARNVMGLYDDIDSIGETFYVVDGDYRTAAQGWTKADGTGPLDLYNQRNRGRVFFTSGVNVSGHAATDAAAMQAAIDACVDFRGDKVLLTPGSFAPATALTLDAANMRLLGVRRGHPKAKVVTVTAGVDAAYTVSVDDVEIGSHTMIPLTATNFIDIASGADRGYLHDLFWNAAGIATSTSTEFCNGAASVDWLVERCAFYIDDEQGDAFTLDSPERWVWQDCDFSVGLTGVAWASVFTFTTSALGNIARRLFFRSCGGATAAVFTKIFTGIANVNSQLLVANCIVDGTALATATDIETTFGTTTDIELAENYQSGDATTEGGTLVKLA